jgi:cell division protein FtsI (penicillin-binding protein 3)
MAKPAARIGLIQAVLVLGAAAVIVRAAQLQLVQGATWKAEAARSRLERKIEPARRGGIYDRNGNALVVTQESYVIGIAPNELTDRTQDARTISRALHLPFAVLQHDLATQKWVNVPGRYNGLEVQQLRPLRGVYLEPHYVRSYLAGPLARAVIGALTPDSGRGASGVELALDSTLTGTPGEAVVLKDMRGRTYQSPSRQSKFPVPGRDVYLTLDSELQEIAERALDDAIPEFQASGADIVILEPRTGEILALASRNTADGRIVSNKASFFTDPFEPGSTAKIFTGGALLALHRVKPDDEVFGENGAWDMPINTQGTVRRISDAHKTTGNLTLAKAIQVSSNIAMGKFAARLSPEEQFEALRAFGFGSPTGVEFPSESPGRLRMPDKWDGFSKPSIAMGYEFEVTPMQLAAGYAALANGGILLTPTLVREIREPGGRVIYRHQPEPVRRAVPAGVADTLLAYLRSVVGKGGTGEAAQLANWVLIGKTGTAVRHDGRAYQSNHYNASFASIFPLDDPQLVVLVKINDPKGKKIYGGETAAPLTRAMLEEALAARRSALDRGRLQARPIQPADTAVSGEGAAADESRVVLTLPVEPDSAGPRGRRPVPNVSGATLRRAVNALHRRGFKVAVRGSGRVQRSTPAAGDSAGYGDRVTLWAE